MNVKSVPVAADSLLTVSVPSPLSFTCTVIVRCAEASFATPATEPDSVTVYVKVFSRVVTSSASTSLASSLPSAFSSALGSSGFASCSPKTFAMV